MEQETLFTASKWDILTELRVKPRSPMELADLLNTSVANISQQMRLLEMAGLVESKRVSNREKGLPRVLYSLSGNHSYLIATAKEFVDKKFHELTERNKVTLRIWFLENPKLHYFLEKAFWRIDDHIRDIDALIYHPDGRDISLIIVTSEDLDLKDFELRNPDGKEKTVRINLMTEEEFNNKYSDNDDLYPLYDPKFIQREKEDRDDKDDGDDK